MTAHPGPFPLPIVVLDPRSFEFLSLLSYAHLKSGSAEAAADLLRALSVVEPGNDWADRTLAYALLLSGQHAECLARIDRRPGASRDKALQLIRGRALWASGRHDDARQVIDAIEGPLRGLNPIPGAGEGGATP